jgi:sRNA-binding carbon storage regulator CsrA
MLVLARVTRENDVRDGRRRGQAAIRLRLPDGRSIWIELLRQRGQDIYVGVEAPEDVEIVREDILMRMEREQQQQQAALSYGPAPAQEERTRTWYDDPATAAGNRNLP